MTHVLAPDLAAAYVRELSADVTGVVVLDGRGKLLTGSEPMAAAARRLPAVTATYLTPHGAVWVATTGERSLIAAARTSALTGPSALDVAAALGATTDEGPPRTPTGPLARAVEDVIAATS